MDMTALTSSTTDTAHWSNTVSLDPLKVGYLNLHDLRRPHALRKLGHKVVMRKTSLLMPNNTVIPPQNTSLLGIVSLCSVLYSYIPYISASVCPLHCTQFKRSLE